MAKANDWTVNLPHQQVATYTWDSDHAVSAHEGFTTVSGLEAPARPWVWRTSDDYDFQESFINHFPSQATTLTLGTGIKKAFIGMATDFGNGMLKNMKDPIWDWPRVTQRQSGETVSSPRNIVDLGELVSSYSLSFS